MLTAVACCLHDMINVSAFHMGRSTHPLQYPLGLPSLLYYILKISGNSPAL